MNNEPVAWIEPAVLPLTYIIKAVVRREQDEQYSIPLYTYPVKELTDEEMLEIYKKVFNKKNEFKENLKRRSYFDFARAILRKASEK